MDSLLTDQERDFLFDWYQASGLSKESYFDYHVAKAQDLKSRKVERKELVEWLETPCRDDSHDKWYAGLTTVFPNRIACTQCWQQLKEGLEEP